MKHDVSERGGALVVAFEGDVDLSTSPEARRVLLEAVERERPVIVDLNAVSYMDSSGVASLVEGLQEARKQGHGFALARAAGAVKRVLELARLDQVFDIHETIEEALG